MNMAMKKSKHTTKYYLNLPWTYTIELDKDNDGNKIFVIRVNEFPGICSDGNTLEEAMESVREALSLAIEVSLESGDEIPVPVDEREYKGKIAYRTSPRRHFLLAKQARQKKMSLSQILDSLIDTTLDRSGK